MRAKPAIVCGTSPARTRMSHTNIPHRGTSLATSQHIGGQHLDLMGIADLVQANWLYA